LATDHPEYLQFALHEGAASGLFAIHRPDAPADVFETKYALKWREQGKPLHFVVFSRNDAAAPQYRTWERPETMPHALLRGRLPAGAPFTKQVLTYGSGHVILHELATVIDGEDGAGRWLVRATVTEPDLDQQLLVLAHQRAPDEVIVRLETFGDPLITPTVRGCVHAVTDWLQSVTDLQVQARNY
jgi:tRNA (guanine-N7-)-methyltransferase